MFRTRYPHGSSCKNSRLLISFPSIIRCHASVPEDVAFFIAREKRKSTIKTKTKEKNEDVRTEALRVVRKDGEESR